MLDNAFVLIEGHPPIIEEKAVDPFSHRNEMVVLNERATPQNGATRRSVR